MYLFFRLSLGIRPPRAPQFSALYPLGSPYGKQEAAPRLYNLATQAESCHGDPLEVENPGSAQGDAVAFTSPEGPPGRPFIAYLLDNQAFPDTLEGWRNRRIDLYGLHNGAKLAERTQAKNGAKPLSQYTAGLETATDKQAYRSHFFEPSAND